MQKTEFQNCDRHLGKLLSWLVGSWISQGEQNRLSIEGDGDTEVCFAVEQQRRKEFCAGETRLLLFKNLVLEWHLDFNNMLALEK